MSAQPRYYASSNGNPNAPLQYAVYGPGQNGLGFDSYVLWPTYQLSNKRDAEAAALIAEQAFQAGRESLRRELRELIGANHGE